MASQIYLLILLKIATQKIEKAIYLITDILLKYNCK
jgi:hypothetical protein